ncbi:RraA family protein [Actinacidiphila glaucinigra]|uniref:RraA family protein n=1 Tax=Actinacidiphila glaucinigra TaxID=235986 RepID=UPI0036B3E277
MNSPILDYSPAGQIDVSEEIRRKGLSAKLKTANIVDAMGKFHRHRCHLSDLVSPTPDQVLFGPVATVSYFPTCHDILPSERYNFRRLFEEATQDSASGRVLVLASNGHPDVSLAGGTKLSLLASHGLAGVLADGRLRDFAELSTCGFAVYCRGESVKWGGEVVTPFEAGRPVVVGGVMIRPGDYVFADSSGAAVVPHEQVLEVLEEAHHVAGEDLAATDGIHRADVPPQQAG